MGRPTLILAALAADAVPGKNFRGIKRLDESENLDSLLLRDADGYGYEFKIPANPQGESELAVERTVIRALAGQGDRVPFEISEELGSTRDADGLTGVVFRAVEGSEPDLAKLQPGAFSKTLADTLAAIHSLDASVVKSAGLPEYDSTAQLHQRVAELDRIAGLGRVPSALLGRWESALEDVGLFRYHPTVVHGGISKENLKLDGQRVTGVTGFQNLRISDPAEDLSWIVGAGLGSTVEDTLLHYRAARPQADENLIQRATLYSELELGTWLAHCVELGDEAYITQAEELIKELNDQLTASGLRDLRAASFIGLVAGSAMLPEITNSLPMISQEDESSIQADEQELPEPTTDEFAATDAATSDDFSEQEVSFDEFFAEPDQESKNEPNPDELF